MAELDLEEVLDFLQRWQLKKLKETSSPITLDDVITDIQDELRERYEDGDCEDKEYEAKYSRFDMDTMERDLYEASKMGNKEEYESCNTAVSSR